MLVIGEKINASNRSVADAINRKDEEYLAELARSQAASGADFIDVNAGAGHGSRESGIANMEWLIDIVQTAIEKPLAIDSDDSDIIAAALRKYRGSELMINSVSAEPFRLEAVGRLAAECQASLVALAMGEGGIPDNAEDRLSACESIISFMTKLGVPAERIYFDPLVLPISVDSNQGLVTLKTLEGIKSRYPTAKTVMGLSNVSYGLPNRQFINRAFLTMAAYAGLDAVILDPLDAKIMSFVKVADLLTGKDPASRKYLRAHRRNAIVG